MTKIFQCLMGAKDCRRESTLFNYLLWMTGLRFSEVTADRSLVEMQKFLFTGTYNPKGYSL